MRKIYATDRKVLDKNYRVTPLSSLIKALVCLPLAFIFFGCSTAQGEKVNTSVLTHLDKEIEQAIANNDFRLYGTSGRRLTIPSINNDKVDSIKERCGIKFLPNTGDVIKSEEQRAERKKNIEYLELYNERMLTLCQKSQK